MILSMRDLPNPKVVRSLSFPLTCTSNRFHSKMKAAAHCPCQTASNFTCHIAPSPSECRWVLGLLEVKRETRNVLSVKVQATHHCKASKKICLQLKNMLYGIIRKWVIYIYKRPNSFLWIQFFELQIGRCGWEMVELYTLCQNLLNGCEIFTSEIVRMSFLFFPSMYNFAFM